MTKMFFMVALLLVAAPVLAADQQPTEQSPCNTAVVAANRARQNEINLVAEQYAAAQAAQRPLTGGGGQGGGTLGCLEKFKDVNIAGGLGLPNLRQEFDKVQKAALDATCNAIDSGYNTVTQVVSAEVVLPGGIAGAKVKLPSAGQIQSNAQNPVRVNTTNPGVVDKAREEFHGIFR